MEHHHGEGRARAGDRTLGHTLYNVPPQLREGHPPRGDLCGVWQGDGQAGDERVLRHRVLRHLLVAPRLPAIFQRATGAAPRPRVTGITLVLVLVLVSHVMGGDFLHVLLDLHNTQTLVMNVWLATSVIFSDRRVEAECSSWLYRVH